MKSQDNQESSLSRGDQVAIRLFAGKVRKKRKNELMQLKSENALFRTLREFKIGLIFALAIAACASDVTLEWDPSPDTWVNGYYLYAHTNSLYTQDPITNYSVKLDCGSSRSVQIKDLQAGLWRFVATAYADTTNTLNGTNTISRLQSPPSNEVMGRSVTAPPGSLRTVHPQWTAALPPGTWTNVGFFRVLITPFSP